MIAAYIARITRALHRKAVSLHLVALRGTVASAERLSDHAAKDDDLAAAVIDQAKQHRAITLSIYRDACHQEGLTRAAAWNEATRIGGTL